MCRLGSRSLLRKKRSCLALVLLNEGKAYARAMNYFAGTGVALNLITAAAYSAAVVSERQLFVIYL